MLTGGQSSQQMNKGEIHLPKDLTPPPKRPIHLSPGSLHPAVQVPRPVCARQPLAVPTSPDTGPGSAELRLQRLRPRRPLVSKHFLPKAEVRK